MNSGVGFGVSASCAVERNRGLESSVKAGGVFTVECFGPDGSKRWSESVKNGVVNSALDDLLNVYLGNGSQTATWYIGLIDNASYSALSASDTMASHAGWIENTDYSQANRPAWTPGAASGQAVTNGTSVDFSMNATKTIRGLFLTSNSTKSGTTGKLFATAAFSGGNQVVNNGDTLKVTYTVSSAAA